MNAHCDIDAERPDDDIEQPLSLAAWIARARRDLEMARAKAHAEVDSFFDEHRDRMASEAELMARDLDNLPRH